VKFIASLIMNASDLRRVIQLWDASGDARNPFAHVLVSPLFTLRSSPAKNAQRWLNWRNAVLTCKQT